MTVQRLIISCSVGTFILVFVRWSA